MTNNPLLVTHENRNMSENSIPGGPSWKNFLDETKEGNIKANVSNARRILIHHPYLKDMFGWSECDEDTMLLRELPAFEGLKPPKSHRGYPCKIQQKHISYIRDMISSLCECNFTSGDVMQACDNAAQQRTFHPIRSYLKSLEWDEKPRLTEWLHKGFGAKKTPLVSSMAFMFLIAAVRRVVFKRYKFDSMLILEGKKGIMKSSGIRALFGDDYFLEGVGDIRKEATTQILSGMWGVEIPEGRGFLNADAATQKEFLSKEEDSYRRAYDRRPVTVARTVVFVMTVNDYQYMIDGSGDRRFWPVRCGEEYKPDIEWIKANRDQLWAEAYAKAVEKDENGNLLYKTYMETQEMEVLTEEQEERQIVDPWEDIIRNHLYGDGMGVPDITSNAIMGPTLLDISPDRRDRSCQMKIGKIMKDLGWSKHRITTNGQRSYLFRRP